MRLVVVVGVGASIVAAALNSTTAQIQRMNSAKAFRLITQIEGLKAELREEIDFGEQPIPDSDAAFVSQLLQCIVVKGVPLSGVPQADAATLGFSSLTVGTLDAENPDGSVAVPGTPASVTLRDGTIVGSSPPHVR